MGQHNGPADTTSVEDSEAARRDPADAYESALSKSLHFLGYRARSSNEVVKFLHKKGFDDLTIAHVCNRLRELGYVDDEVFAESYVGNRQESTRKASKAKMRNDLMRKGVAKETVERAMERLPGDYETEAARELAERLAAKLGGVEPAVRNKKIVGHLMRRGFSYESAQSALRALKLGEI